MPPRRRRSTCAAVAVAIAAALGLAPSAASQPLSVRSLEIAPSIQAYWPVSHAALSATSLLIGTTGVHAPPNHCAVALLIEDVDREAKVTPLPTPSSGPCRSLVRLSPTRALLLVDEGVYLLDDLGATNRVSFTAHELGGALGAARLEDDTAVAITGAALEHRLLVLSVLADSLRVTETAAFPHADGLVPLGPRTFLLTEARNQYFASLLRVEEDGTLVTELDLELRNAFPGHGKLVLLSSTSFLFPFDEVPSSSAFHGEDDGVYLFTGLGGGLQRTELATPYFATPREFWHGPGITRLSARRAILPSPGPDGTLGNEDDRVLVLDDLGGANEVVPVATPSLAAFAPLRLRADRALVGVGRSAPSSLVPLLDVGDSNVLGPGSSPLPVLYFGSSDVLPIAPEGALLANKGADPQPTGPGDDTVEWITSFGASPSTEQLPLPGIGTPYHRLAWLGNGRAFKSDWVQPPYGLDGSHHLHFLEGLGGLSLEAERISLRFRREYGASLRASARLFLPEPTDLAASDLTVRIGNAWQTIPAAAIEATPTGYLYHDPKGSRGFLRRLEYDAAVGRLFLKGRGRRTRAATTRPDNLVLSLEGLFLYAAESLDGRKRGDRITYRAP